MLAGELFGFLAGMEQEHPDPAPAEGDKAKDFHGNEVTRRSGHVRQVDASMAESAEEVLEENLCMDEFVFMAFPEASKTEGSSAPAPKAPPDFFLREAYVELEQEGLVCVPPLTGCGLFYHKPGKQWHSRFGESNRAPRWGPGLRSERRAILLALEAMWIWYSRETGAKSDLEYCARLQSKLEETPN